MKHFRKVLLVVAILQLNATFAQKLNCENYKEGTFRSVNGEIDDKYYRVVRKGNLQIETDSKAGIEIKQSVEWISDCSFKLTFISANKVYMDKYSTPNDSKVLVIDILRGGVNFYQYTARYENEKKIILTGNILKLE